MITGRGFEPVGNNKGLVCPFRGVTCQEGFCTHCQLYLEWELEKSTWKLVEKLGRGR